MGNSEVGHLTIGSGRVLDQDFQRVNRAVASGSFFENEALVSAFRRAQERGGDVHLLGLVSYGGVHSHIDHLRALLELAQRDGMTHRTWIHAFTDGRDVSPHAALRDLAELPADRIATVAGRYYAMDRDKRWERTASRARRDRRRRTERTTRTRCARCRRATRRRSPTSSSCPWWSTGGRGSIPAKDTAIFFNFRPDRARQLSERLGGLETDLTTMTKYRDDFDIPDRVPRAEGRHGDGRGTGRPRRPAAPHGGDREVRPRDVLLQRRPRGRSSPARRT